MQTRNRWWIAFAGVLLQMALGAVYAWSVFRIPLTKRFGWTISQVTLTFTIAIMVLGFASFFGGLWLKRVGPRVVAMTGGVLYGVGIFLASFSNHGLWWLYLTYGVIGGIGLGFGYIVPVAVLLKWFPDKRGLMTGIAVGGFGAGALVTAPIATRLIQSVGVLQTFAYLGVAYLIVSVASGWFMQNPPDGWKPEGWTPTEKELRQKSAKDFTLNEALKTWQWWALWLLLFLNTSAGISLISQEAPIFEELAKITAITAAGMVGIVSIGNALGRVFWAWTSDTLGRKMTFAAMFFLQILLFWFLPESSFHSSCDDCGLHHSDVLRRRVWDDACVCGGLLRAEECWADLWVDADGVGICKRVRASADGASASGQRNVCGRTARDLGSDDAFGVVAARGEAA